MRWNRYNIKYMKKCVQSRRQKLNSGVFLQHQRMDRQLLRQKVRQRISVMKTNTGVFVVFKKKRELKCQFSGNIECVCFPY